MDSATDILRWAGCMNGYATMDPVVREKAMLRGRRADLGAEYICLGASLDRAHCASHLKERATRRVDNETDTDLLEAMRREADRIAFGEVSDDGWCERNRDCVCIPYLQAAQKFYKEHPCTLLEAQFTVVNKTLGYQGHPDHLIETPRHYELLSIKTGAMPAWAGVQEALYLLADPETFQWPTHRYNIRRAVVQFRADGGYTYAPLNEHRDFEVAQVWAAGYAHARRICGDNLR